MTIAIKTTAKVREKMMMKAVLGASFSIAGRMKVKKKMISTTKRAMEKI